MKKFFTFFMFLCCVTFAAYSYACEGSDCALLGFSGDSSKVGLSTATNNIKSQFPAGTVVNVSASPLAGIFEVKLADERVVYVDGSGRYAFIGELVDIKTKENLTKKATPEKKIDFASLPLENAIKIGSAKRKIAIFADPDCGYCGKLHKEVESLVESGDLEAYYFLFPLREKTKSVSIWCQGDRKKALDEAYQGKQIERKECGNPIESNLDLGRKLGLRGTPMVIIDNNVTVPGYVPKDRLKELLGTN